MGYGPAGIDIPLCGPHIVVVMPRPHHSPSAPTNPILRVGDIAAELGCSYNRAQQLVARGVIPGIKVGRSWWIPTAAWQTWLTEQTRLALDAVRVQGAER